MEGHGNDTGFRRTAFTLWGVCAALLLGPPALVWMVRGAAYAAHCAPGPELCRGMLLGAGLRDALALTWSLAANALLLVLISTVAASAALFARRPLLGTLSILLLPLLAPLLPMIAVFTAKYPNCAINSDGIGSCLLWGAQMGMSFHTAAAVRDMIYDIAPYSFALTLVLGLLGWFFTRPRAPRRAMAHNMRRIGER